MSSVTLEEKDEEVDIEGDFHVPIDQLIVDSVNTKESENDQVKLSEDIDADSKATILKIMSEDNQTSIRYGFTYPLPSPPSQKTTQAMENTSRRQRWNMEEHSLFLTGLEIYGRSWKHIAELIPTKTPTQVKSHAVKYFVRLEREKIKPKKEPKYHYAKSTRTVSESGELASSKEVQVIKESQQDEDVDILNDSDCSSDSDSDDMEDNSPASPAADSIERLPPNSLATLTSSTSTVTYPRDILVSAPHEGDPEKSLNNYNVDKSPIKLERTIAAGVSSGDTDDEAIPSRSVSELISDDPFREQGLIVADPIDDGLEDDMFDKRLSLDKQSEVLQKMKDTDVVEEDSQYTKPTSRAPIYEPEYGVLNSNGELVPLPAPECEAQVNRDNITELEMTVHFEFFENRLNKTPDRYMKIRNYILDQWEKVKPNYLNKTSVRAGLKNCGDVNGIGRIHSFLEQLGAINFGCVMFGKLSRLLRGVTLDDTRTTPTTKAAATDNKDSHGDNSDSYSSSVILSCTAREAEKTEVVSNYSLRHRKRRPKDHSVYVEGITRQHNMDSGDDEDDIYPTPAKKTSKVRDKSSLNDNYMLVGCEDFVDSEKGCPYRVDLESTAAVVIDVHAHLCKTEVIGLLGGVYDDTSKVLKVLRAEPCSSHSTSIHCDMDPVSQTQAGQLIQAAGLSVVGWYHSHPTFIPNPSKQDIESQEAFQKWFLRGGDHFLGLIISPYNITNQTVGSEICCFTTATKRNATDNKSTPFKFDYKIVTSSENREISSIVPKICRLLEMYKDYEHCVDLLDTYRSTSDLTSLEKMLLSIRSYLLTADHNQIDTRLLIEDLRFVLTSFAEKKN